MDNRKMGGHRRLNDQEFANLLRELSVLETPRKSLRETVSLWWNRWHERRKMARDLGTFPNEVLEDFGMTRSQAEELVNKPFWRA